MDNARLRRQKAVEKLLEEMRRRKEEVRIKRRADNRLKREAKVHIADENGPTLTLKTQGERKTKAILLKVTERERKHLRYRAHKANMYVTEYIRTTMRIGMEYV